MFSFQVDGRDNFSGTDRTCNFCCADQATVVPCERNPWMIDYSPWLLGIQGRGLCQPISFSIEKLSSDPVAPFPSMLPPANIDYNIQIAANTAFSGSVATGATSPQDSPLTFKIDTTSPPSHGIVAMNTDGIYVYSPTTGYVGLDQFGYFTMDGVNAPVENVVNIGVDIVVSPPFEEGLPPGVVIQTNGDGGPQLYATPIPPNSGLLYVDPQSLCIRSPFIKFTLVASCELTVGQVYRLKIVMSAMDCDRATYRHISTYDILVTKCGF